MPTATLDLSSFKPAVIGTKRVMQAGTARAVRIALRESADHARTNHIHTRRTGHLTSKEMLRGEVREANDRGSWGWLRNDAHYVRHVEFRTKPHLIRPKEGSGLVGPLQAGQSRRSSSDIGTHRVALRFQVGGKTVFRRVVHHPGTPAQPFMFPAAEHGRTVIIRETENHTFHLAAQVWE